MSLRSRFSLYWPFPRGWWPVGTATPSVPPIYDLGTIVMVSAVDLGSVEMIGGLNLGAVAMASGIGLGAVEMTEAVYE